MIRTGLFPNVAGRPASARNRSSPAETLPANTASEIFRRIEAQKDGTDLNSREVLQKATRYFGTGRETMLAEASIPKWAEDGGGNKLLGTPEE